MSIINHIVVHSTTVLQECTILLHLLCLHIAVILHIAVMGCQGVVINHLNGQEDRRQPKIYLFFLVNAFLYLFCIFPISDKVASLLLYANYLREVYSVQTRLFTGDFLQAPEPEGCLPLLNKTRP